MRRAVVLNSAVVAMTVMAWLVSSDQHVLAQADSQTPTPSPGPTVTSGTPNATIAATPSAAPAATAQATMGTDADPFRDREDRMALIVGRARVAAGLLPLARSRALDRAAVTHAQDMARSGYMEHDAPPGSAWLVVETISARSDDPDGALDWWLSDGLHRRVLLRTGWRELGLGY